jgi:hypothetical protein
MNKLVLEEPKFILNEATPVATSAPIGQNIYMQQYNSNPDKLEVINNFITAFETQYGIKLNTSLIQAVGEQILSMGGGDALDYYKNPYLQFLVNYSKLLNMTTIDFTGESYNNLIHLYGDKVISDNNMFAKGSQGQNDIIFVKDLWTQQYNEIKYLCQAFYWLNIKSNLSSLNLDKLGNDDGTIVKNFISYLGGDVTSLDRNEKTGRMMSLAQALGNDPINYILFVDKKFSFTGQLRQANQISRALDYLDTVQTDLGTKIETENDADRIRVKKVKNPSKWSSKGIDTKSMSKDDAEELIKYTLDTFNIKL